MNKIIFSGVGVIIGVWLGAVTVNLVITGTRSLDPAGHNDKTPLTLIGFIAGASIGGTIGYKFSSLD